MSSPVFSKNQNFQPGGGTRTFGVPESTNSGVMTFDNTMRKIIGLFLILLATAGIGWIIPALTLPAAIIGLVLGLVNAFKKEPSVPLIVAYAGFQGLFVGGISKILEVQYDGIVTQAVLATFCVIGVTLFLYKTGIVRASAKMTKFFIIATSAYLLFSLINFGMMIFGATDSAWGMRSDVEIMGIPLGIFLGVFAVLLGTYSLILDFTFIENGVKNHVPERYGWTAAFGIMVTVIWLYVEILRLIAISRD